MKLGWTTFLLAAASAAAFAPAATNNGAAVATQPTTTTWMRSRMLCRNCTSSTWPDWTAPPVEEELAEAGGARRALQLRLQPQMGRAGGGEDNRLSMGDLPTPHDVAGGLYLLEC